MSDLKNNDQYLIGRLVTLAQGPVDPEHLCPWLRRWARYLSGAGRTVLVRHAARVLVQELAAPGAGFADVMKVRASVVLVLQEIAR